MDLIKDPEFRQWFADFKARIRRSQVKAMIKVNDEMLRLYWDLGHDIVVRRMDAKWGSGFYKDLSRELKTAFPDMLGFSTTNLNYCKRFYQFYTNERLLLQQIADEIHPQVEGESKTNPLFSIPWGHQKHILDKCKSVHEALFYVQKTIKNGWSRAMLMNFMDADLYQSQGKAVNNFDRLLPDVQSDLAKETLKDPFNFDFLTLTENYKEKELENALVENITKFLLELGQGFAFVGRQYPIQIGNVPRTIDLLFYHLNLRCYVVIELKAKKFEPEYTGKLGYYVVAVNKQLKKETDNPTIGLLVCKTKDNIEAQYSLESSSQPIGISEYTLSKLIPENFKSSLPSIEEIERELNKE
jgi:predicted nuclease of restriction endonuclease-like (RecB) superfamily